MTSSRILFIQTGGTIDKDYPRVSGYAFEIADPAFDRVLSRANPNFGVEKITVLKKDSLDFTDADRQAVFDACTSATTDKIVVTHGTDTMVETAKKLSAITKKTIVLTGAMRPEKFYDSDADFNIGTAVGAVQCLPAGVYLAMNGCIYRWDNVRKDVASGKFVEKKQ